MLREQHFSSLFRHYGKHNGVDKETLVFFFTEELMRELEPNDTPKSVHLKKNDVIVIRHRRMPQADNLVMRLDLNAADALELIRAFPKARSLQSTDGRTALHHLAARAGRDGMKEQELATQLLLAGCDPSTLDNYGRSAADIAKHHRQHDLAQLLAPHEFKRQMAVIRAHFLGGSAYATGGGASSLENKPDIILKRPCNKQQPNGASAVGGGGPGTSGGFQDSHSSGGSTNGEPTNGSDDTEMTPVGAKPPGYPQREDAHNACVRFLFSNLAHGNQARNFKRVVCFLYA